MSHTRQTTLNTVCKDGFSMGFPAFLSGAMGVAMAKVHGEAGNVFGKWMGDTFGPYLTWCPWFSRTLTEVLNTFIYQHPGPYLERRGAGSSVKGALKVTSEWAAGFGCMFAFGTIMVKSNVPTGDSEQDQFTTNLLGGMAGDIVFQVGQMLASKLTERYLPSSSSTPPAAELTHDLESPLAVPTASPTEKPEEPSYPCQELLKWTADVSGWAIMGNFVGQAFEMNGYGMMQHHFYVILANTALTDSLMTASVRYAVPFTKKVLEEKSLAITPLAEEKLLPLPGETPVEPGRCVSLKATIKDYSASLKKPLSVEVKTYLLAGTTTCVAGTIASLTPGGKSFCNPSSPWGALLLRSLITSTQETGRRFFSHGISFFKCGKRSTKPAQAGYGALAPTPSSDTPPRTLKN